MNNIETLDPVTVGTGVTESVGSDAYAGTVTRVSDSGKTLWFKQDRATRVDANGGYSEEQTYTYAPNADAQEHKAILGKGGWKIVGGYRLRVGVRRQYRDPSF